MKGTRKDALWIMRTAEAGFWNANDFVDRSIVRISYHVRRVANCVNKSQVTWRVKSTSNVFHEDTAANLWIDNCLNVIFVLIELDRIRVTIIKNRWHYTFRQTDVKCNQIQHMIILQSIEYIDTKLFNMIFPFLIVSTVIVMTLGEKKISIF